MFRSNFFDFAKKCSEGKLLSSQQKPQFSKEEADKYFLSKYSEQSPLDFSQLNWFPWLPDRFDTSFDMNAIKPKDIKNILRAKKSKSAPGDDGIMYGILRNLPTTHRFMATLFTKILTEGDPPECWKNSRITLLHKGGDTKDPSNFRMIALTSCVGKLYHQILASRTISYLQANNLIDTTTQKAFLPDVSGCIEHSRCLTEIIADARHRKRTVHVTFFDLADAFGSVNHDLIAHTLERNGIPPSIIRYVKDSPEKFLGTWVTGSSHGCMNMIRDKIETTLNNIDSVCIRPEYKLKIYTKYFLYAIKFLLSVHDLTKTQRSSLDKCSSRFLKKWLNMPQGATLAIVHCQQGMDIPTISQVYSECHAQTVAHCLIRADERVNAAMTACIAREESYSRKSYGNTDARDMVNIAMNTTPDRKWSKVKSNITCAVKNKYQDIWTDKVEGLLLQGKFLELMRLEQEDLTWKSIIYDLPSKVLSFAVRSSIDCLPTFRNLQRWGKKLSANCKLCGNKQTLLHVLNGCKIMLEQGRYTWRHNNILNAIYECLQSSISGDYTLRVDLPDKANHPTIPMNILPTPLRPDLVLSSVQNKEVIVVELTVPFEQNIDSRHVSKCNKYAPLTNDIIDQGYSCKLFCIEVGSRGYVSKQNKVRIKSLLKTMKLGKKNKAMLNRISKMSIMTSYSLFLAKDQPTWTEPPLLSVPENNQS
ncbi:uncharacterized protein LOC121416780 [Lytechinus variegatus]|uniref:uncharacterized protein LOC121416780 n=1 Tax=Lytechinus variegatus TaxID=7654 RepID=UPI001BB2CB9B|nr:uncharacterized protein LOC121416780 [Lytechinus variegatus]